ncbi:hypothetical protein [Glutamicibacter ardleyensis]|uniref:hypothetical protein n=1 Tax=Glutamicibacter ardleyensis TaxID=225894 RepID=UPI003FD12C70
MSLEVFEAVKALLPPTTRVHLFEAKLSSPPALADFPYVVLHGGFGTAVSGERDNRSSDDLPDQVAYLIRCTVVATSKDGLNHLVGVARSALNRQRPVVPGWSFSKLRQVEVLTAEPDNRISIDTLNPLYAVDEYPFMAYRA